MEMSVSVVWVQTELWLLPLLVIEGSRWVPLFFNDKHCRGIKQKKPFLKNESYWRKCHGLRFQKESLSKGRLAEWDESCILSSDSAYLCSALMLEKYPEDLFIPLRFLFFFGQNLYKEPEFLVFVKLVWIAECQRFSTSLQINKLVSFRKKCFGWTPSSWKD